MGTTLPHGTRARVERALAAHRSRAPATAANAARNARAGSERHARWRPARDALWRELDPLLDAGARVAVVGAGNADDLPLRRLADRAGVVVLLDCDRAAPAAARRRLPRALRRRVEVVGHDVTGGAADAVTRAAAAQAGPGVPGDPLPGAPYDVVVGDLFYSQLLYPGLVDLGVPVARADAVVAAAAPDLVRAVVARLHASAPAVVHVHDPLAWWEGRRQPVSLREVLDLAGRDPEAAAALAGTGNGPRSSDPRAALGVLGLPIRRTALWHWPFAPGVEYLACATLSGAPGHAPAPCDAI